MTPNIIITFGVLKYKWFIISVWLGIYLCIPSIVFAKETQDSLVMNRIFSYKRNFSYDVSGIMRNIYLRYSFHTVKRNPTLFFVPTMYTIAKGSRNYIGETYGKMILNDIDNYDIHRQVTVGNIPSHRKTMPNMLKYVTPKIYNVSLFGDYMLSPFNYNNRLFYRYRISILGNGEATITYTPRLKNTQLVRGFAIVDRFTGRVIRTKFRGEYDMIKFEVNADMGNSDRYNTQMPKSCESKANFSFLGNKINTRFTAVYDCDTILPDSMNDVQDMNIMNKLRPDKLDNADKEIYKKYHKEQARADSVNDKSTKRRNKFKKIAWDIVGDHMLNSMEAGSSNVYVNLSPLLNPLYLSYSQSRGLAYKMNIGSRYNFSSNRYLTLDPRLGYNFKIKKFYFTAPLRYTFNARRNAWLEIVWANGNRITDSGVLDMIKNEHRDTIDFSSLDLDYFNDQMLNISANYSVTDEIDILLGCVYHRRSGVNKRVLEMAGKPTLYNSFAPLIKLTLRPYPTGPVFTANYERSFRGMLKSNMEYEKFEFDASYKKTLRSLRQYNLRVGGGFYTNQSTNFFVDFTNFHENYLPEGWDDDWTGEFQLLNSQWYNASKYYIRANASYESPLLLLTWLPFVGRYIETERFYVSALQIEKTRPYFELGYGFTNRYFSVGLFGSFLNGQFHEFGSKFTFELFRKW